MGSLVHDGAFGFAGDCGGGGKTGAQAVPGKFVFVLAKLGRPALDDDGNGLGRQALAQNLVVAVDTQEHGTRFDCGGRAPVVYFR